MRRNLNEGIFFTTSLTRMEESVILRPFIIAVATVAALGISFSSTDASAAGPGGRGSYGGGGGGGAAVPSGGGGMGGGGMGRSGMGGGGTFGGAHPSFSASPSRSEERRVGK